MFKNKKMAIVLVSLVAASNILGYYASSVKEELVLIDSFVKELRYEHTEQAQKLVKYLDKILKNDFGDYGTPEYRWISDDEILAIDRILISDDMSYENKKAGVFNVMLEELEKAAKEKEKAAQVREEIRKTVLHNKIITGCGAIAYVAAVYLLMKYTPEIDKMLREMQKSPGWFRKAAVAAKKG